MLGNLYVSLPMKIIQKYELLSVSLEFNSISRLFENLEIRCMWRVWVIWLFLIKKAFSPLL